MTLLQIINVIINHSEAIRNLAIQYNIDQFYLAKTTDGQVEKIYFLYQIKDDTLSLIEKYNLKIQLCKILNIQDSQIGLDDRTVFDPKFFNKKFTILMDIMSLSNDQIKNFFSTLMNDTKYNPLN